MKEEVCYGILKEDQWGESIKLHHEVFLIKNSALRLKDQLNIMDWRNKLINKSEQLEYLNSEDEFLEFLKINQIKLTIELSDEQFIHFFRLIENELKNPKSPFIFMFRSILAYKIIEIPIL